MTDVEPAAPVPILVAGWYTHDGRRQYWSGVKWTDVKPPDAGWYPSTTRAGTQQYWDGVLWTENYAPLAPQTAGLIINNNGGRVYKTSHGFHLIMTIITGGLWGIFVWIPVGIYNASRNR